MTFKKYDIPYRSHTPNSKAKKENKAKSESKLNNSTASVDTDLEEIQRREKEKKVFKNWRNKASMSKLGKGTRSLVRCTPHFFTKNEFRIFTNFSSNQIFLTRNVEKTNIPDLGIQICKNILKIWNSFFL